MSRLNIKGICKLILLASALMMFAAQSPFAEQQGTNRPLKGSVIGSATIDVENNKCLAGYAYVTTTALGNLSHLGLTVTRMIHCANSTGTDYTNTDVKLIAANGDELWATYAFIGKSADGTLSFLMNFNNGTGRFENATGTAYLDARVKPVIKNGKPDFTVPWPWQATIEGSISY